MKFKFGNTVQPLNFSANGGFDNPCFDSESSTKGSAPVSPSDNPVVAPSKRRVSTAFPAYLQRRGSNAPVDGVAVPAIHADSTKNLQPYSTVNHESVPRLENYSNLGPNRPTFDELHRPVNYEDGLFGSKDAQTETERGLSSVKFGWFEGVFVRTCVNLLGVMLFMRMGWMTGQAGIVVALLQIILATAITCLTTLSMNALCTNGDIGAGGIYSMISRSLGPEAGAVIGIIFAFTNAAFVGLNLIGAAEAVVQVLDHFNIPIISTPHGLNDLRIVGFAFLIFIALIPIISLQFEAKTQSFFLILLVICIGDYFVGAVIPPTTIEQKNNGFVGWSFEVANENLWPKWDNATFFSVFGVFFPSVTPIFTGACMSGDLKDPASAIPKGTFLSIATTSLTYAIFIIVTGFTIVSYSTGNLNQTMSLNASICPKEICPFGLVNDYNTVALSSGLSHVGLTIEPFIYAGILAASLSSALGCYMAAPRIFQSFAEDRLLPYISWFAKGYGPANDPRRGYVLTFIVALIFTAIGELNQIAPYISNFYLASFFLVNVTCFHAAWVKTPSFRPAFRYFNKWLSLFAGAVCFILMFLLDVVSAVTSTTLMVVIWLYMAKKSPDVNWGTTSEAQLFNLAHTAALKLYWSEEHVKNYRPRILLLAGNPSARPALVDMAANVTKEYGMLFLAHVKEGQISYQERFQASEAQKIWMRFRKVKAFYVLVEANSIEEGIRRTLPTTGLGKLRPNIVMIGYKTNWHECTENDLMDYFNIINNVLDMRYSLIICRVQEGFDFSDFFTSVESEDAGDKVQRNISFPSHLDVIPESPVATPETTVKSLKDFLGMAVRVDKIFTQSKKSLTEQLLEEHPEVPRQVINSVNQFQKPQKPGHIDVWWLYDTGGIALLVAWILRNNQLWRNCKIRVFTVIKDAKEIDSTKSNLTELLQKFRIPYSDVTVLSDANPPSDESKLQFRDVISDWMLDEDQGKAKGFHYPPMRITKSELIALKELTNRHIRLRELLLQYSADATLIVMTLPLPRKGVCSAPLYMAWLEMLTQNMPPFLLVRGNQSNVLTFYC